MTEQRAMSDYQVYEAVLDAKRTGQPAVLAIIIHDKGSVPRHAGSKMLIYPDGKIIGTIGGGELESRVIAEVPKLLNGGQPAMLHYELVDPERGDPGVCGGQVDVFMEPILPDPAVLVIGCGHVGQAVADLAHWLGFRVIVTDDRQDLCNPQVIPAADEYLAVPPDKIVSTATIHNRTFVVAVTRGVPFDVAMLPDLLNTPAPYIGVIGSRRRWATTVKQLQEQGISEDALRRIHAPIGLDIKAETPREIAVSIMAEVILSWRGSSERQMEGAERAEEASSSSQLSISRKKG
jgi:xanthine dehydrogenase accessory factor